MVVLQQMNSPKSRSAALAVFARQLALLVNSGVGLLQALELLQQQVDEPGLRSSLEEILQKLHSGHKLSVAFAEHPDVFGPLVVSMIKLGEESGALAKSLERLAEWLESDQRTLLRVHSALIYPAIVVILSGVLTLLLFVFVLPAFVEVFAGFQLKLPWLTRAVLFVVSQLRNPLTWLVALALGLEFYRRWPALWRSRRSTLVGWLSQMPGFGEIYRYAALARLCAALNCTLPVGIPVLRAWTLAAQASGCPLFFDDATRVVSCCREGGETLTEALEVERLYPRSLVEMIRAGEESGRMGPLLSRLGGLYEMDMDYRLTILAALLEPMLLTLISLLVIFLILSLMLPLYTLIEQVSG